MKWIFLLSIVIFAILFIYYFWTQQVKLERKDLFSLESYSIKYKKEIRYHPPEINFKIYDFPLILDIYQCIRICKESIPLLKEDIITIPGINDEHIIKKNCLTCYLDNEDTQFIQSISSILTKQPISNMEKPEISKYEEGHFYDFHYDMKTNNSTCIATIYVYLNDDFTGGETDFESFVIHPEKGKLILVWNSSHGKRIIESRHSQRHVIIGTKWLLTQKIHSVPL